MITVIMQDIANTKNIRKNELNNISYKMFKIKSSYHTLPYIKEHYNINNSNSTGMLNISKEDLKNDIKGKYKKPWKTPGYVNSEFGEILPIKPKVI